MDAYEPAEPVHGFPTLVRDTPPFEAFRDPHAQRDLDASQFPEQVWRVPWLVAAMRASEDLFFDIVSQIHMPAWSHGRVALTGDAARATSFLSGQGRASRSSAPTSWPASSPHTRTTPRPPRRTSAGCAASRSATRRWPPAAAPSSGAASEPDDEISLDSAVDLLERLSALAGSHVEEQLGLYCWYFAP
ncbi:hypothetical protein [Streptomyces albogriseolus]|uniref:hypothetical protein n=1 Tax=Streptomyces albogriseolus TaxID=1887 RepID=UPI0036A342E2